MKHFKRLLPALLIITMMLALVTGCDEAAQETTQNEESQTPADDQVTFTAGTYEGSGVGNNGSITLSVTFSDTEITKIDVIAQGETKGISDPAFSRIPKAILDNQSLAVDAVTGATNSSNGIMEAVTDAITKAGGNVDVLKSRQIASVKPGATIEKTADVIVIGGGGAGISAATSAAQNGAKVILIEKTAYLGGNTLASGFAWNAVNPEKQNLLDTMPGQVDTLKEVLNYKQSDFPAAYAESLATLQQQIADYLAGDTLKMFDSVEFHKIQAYLGGKRQDKDGNWIEGNYDLINILVTNSLPTLKWVETFGPKFNDRLTAPVGSMWTRGHSPSVKTDVFEMMSDYVTNKSNTGSEILLETPAKELIVENGAVVGVKAQQADGTEVILHADNVILTTGGFGPNIEMVAKYNNYWPSIPTEMKTTNVASNTGDGITMASAVNANLVGMEFAQLMPTANAITGSLTDALLVAPQNYVFVNKQGKRFVNEYAGRDTLSFAALEQTNGMFYTIADSEMAKTVQDGATQEKIDAMVNKGLIYRADTLEELAAIIGADPQVFVNEINTYNSYVDAGKDPEYGKSVFEMKVLKAPFYACPARPATHHTMGGLEINTNGQVLSAEGTVIDGLYAAGEVAGGIHAGNRLGGNAIADVFVFGKIAGEHAAKN